MANLKKTIEIIFAGVDQVTPITEAIGGGLSKVGQGVQKATQPLADLSDSILLTSAAITALGVAAVAFSAKEAIQLENSFVELQKVLGDADGKATDFGDTFANISNKFGVGQADVISLAADFKQAGFTIDESLKLVEEALKAAAISELDVDSAGDVVIRTLNGFQAPASEAGRLIDILNESSNNFAVTTGELGQGLSRLSPIASQLGYNFEESAGLLIPIIEVFGSGSEAANGLRTSLLKLASDSKPVVEALKSVGIDSTQVVSAKDRFKALAEVFPTLNSEQKTYVTRAIAGIEQASKFAIVLGNQQQVLKATESAYNASGSAVKELEIALAKTEVAVQRFQNSLINIASSIGTKILPSLGKVTNASTVLSEAVLKSLEEDNFKKVFEALNGVFNSLEQDIKKVAAAFPEAIKKVDFQPILDGVAAVRESFGKIFDQVDLTTPEGLAEAIQFIVDTLGSLGQVTAGIISEFDGVFGAVGSTIDNFNNLTDAQKQAAGESLGLGKILNSLGGILDTVGTAIEGIGAAVGVLIGAKGLISLKELFSGTTTTFTSFIDAAKTSAGSLAGATTATTAFTASVAALLLPLAGLVGIFAELKDQSISGFIDEVTDFSDKQKIASETTDIFGAEIGGLSKRLLDGEIDIKQFNRLMDEYNDKQILASFATMENTQANRDNTLALLKTSEGIAKFQELTKGATESTDGLSASLDDASNKSPEVIRKEALDRMFEAAEQFDKARKSTDELGTSLQANGNKVDQFGRSIGQAGQSATSVANSLDEVNGKVIEVTAKAKVQTAQQQLEQFQTVVNSLDETIASTGNALGSFGQLFGSNFGNLDLGAQFAIKDAFREEVAARQKALDLQNKLIETEIDLQQARLKAIESGDSTITIDTTGIEPILDLLLTTIIKNAQARATADGAAFLAGVI